MTGRADRFAGLDKIIEGMKREAKAKRDLARTVSCRTCGAQAGEPCRTARGVVTAPHGPRYYDARAQR